MNPPFKLATQFVDRALEMGARKIVCFQKFAWWEGSRDRGKKRGQWWAANPPNRIYVCGERATCWRIDFSPAERAARKTSTPTAHAWFVWERGHPQGTVTGHVYK